MILPLASNKMEEEFMLLYAGFFFWIVLGIIYNMPRKNLGLHFVSEKVHVEKEKKFQSPLEKPKKVKREKSISYV